VDDITNSLADLAPIPPPRSSKTYLGERLYLTPMSSRPLPGHYTTISNVPYEDANSVNSQNASEPERGSSYWKQKSAIHSILEGSPSGQREETHLSVRHFGRMELDG
jgi:hypothetical protein